MSPISPLKMFSMASIALVGVLGVAMLDIVMPDTFFQLVLSVVLMALVLFLGYRLVLAIRDLQARGKSYRSAPTEYRGVFALGLMIVVIGIVEVYMITNPAWDYRVLMAGGWIVFLVYFISRFMMQADFYPLIGSRKD